MALGYNDILFFFKDMNVKWGLLKKLKEAVGVGYDQDALHTCIK